MDAPFARARAIVRALEPVRLAQVFLDFAAVVGAQFWDGRRTGPDFISPTASLTKRPSGHLARLVLQHGQRLADAARQEEGPWATEGVAGSGAASTYPPVHHPQAVVVLDLDAVAAGAGEAPRRRLESQYTTSADVDLMVLVPILLCLLVVLRRGQWSPAFEFIAIDFVGALILGPGTLTLIRRTGTHPAELDPGDGCAVLMDDDLTVVVQGSQRIVEAITEGGFYLSFAAPRPQPPARDQCDQMQAVVPTSQRWQEKQLVSDILYGTLEGGCRGACEAMAMRFLHLNVALPRLGETALVVVLGRMMGKACWWGLRASANDNLLPVAGVTPLRSVARLTGELLGLLVAAACFATTSSATIVLHGASFFAHTSYFGLFARLVLRSQNYRIRMERFLDALGRPPVRTWLFHTRASAATFVCLVLCRDLARPVKGIHVLGVLDTLIPNQRDIWRVWKERVADRILHEAHITFAPTLPTFADWRQERLKLLLDEAQTGYQTYLSLPLGKSVESRVHWLSKAGAS